MATIVVASLCRGAGRLAGLSGLFFLLSVASSVRADFSAEFVTASSPLDEGVPEVAITRLRTLLGKNLTQEQWSTAGERLAQALIAANRPAEALNLLQDNKLAGLPSMKFWRAQALASLHRWAEALPLYEAIALNAQSTLRREAIFGQAEMLRALHRPDDALQKLAPLLQEKDWNARAHLRSAELFLDKSDPGSARRMLDQMQGGTTAERKERRFLRGRLEIVQHRPDRALANLEGLIKKSEGASHALILAALFAIADAHLQLNTPESGDDFLEDFIDHRPHDAALPLLFVKLDELYRAERKPIRAELERWTREPEQPRRGLAQWYLARIELRAGHRDRALQLFSNLRKSEGKTADHAPGLIEFGQLQSEDRNYEQASQIFDEARALKPEPALLHQIDFLAAETRYAARQFKDATAEFERIAYSDSPMAKLSIFNASLGWLQLGDHARFAAAYDEWNKQGGGDERAELRLEEGLLRAGQGQPDAADFLQKFVKEFPTSSRVSEAWVALAELAFHANPPRLEDARNYLARAGQSNPTPAAKERAEYLVMWIEDASGGNSDKLIEQAVQFLRQYPASGFGPDVRMKLAEAYYLRQDFSNAQTQFEIFAQQNPSSAMTEKALFFAAESAMASMAPHSIDRAIVLFDQVAQLKGDLRWAARNEQAVIERRLGKPQDALLLYDEVLKNDAKPGEKREALCGKGDVFFDLSSNDPSNYERAIAAYDQLAADAPEPGHWRNQALFKKAVCFEKRANQDAALATFYQVLETPTRPDRPPEFFWFYKAGFNAARLLETGGQWNSAASIYEKLVAAGGTRSEEAKLRLNRLRLEHFLWQD